MHATESSSANKFSSVSSPAKILSGVLISFLSAGSVIQLPYMMEAYQFRPALIIPLLLVTFGFPASAMLLYDGHAVEWGGDGATEENVRNKIVLLLGVCWAISHMVMILETGLYFGFTLMMLYPLICPVGYLLVIHLTKQSRPW